MNIIEEYEKRGEAVGIAVNALCEVAGVNRSTWQRWKAGQSSPRLHHMEVVNAHLEAAEAKSESVLQGARAE